MKSNSLKLISAFIALIMIASCLPFNGFAFTEYEFGDYKYTVDGSNATITYYSETAEGNVIIPSSISGYMVTTIGKSAFYACTGIDKVVIPESVTRIEDYAFAWCVALEGIEIPASVTFISNNAFSNCERFKIKCESGSYAERYARENKFSFETYGTSANVYNLGEETYSFENYGDTSCSQDGHCFGMAVTSSGYYIGKLDKSIIGGNDDSSLYSFTDTPTVRKPICHYYKIQGSVGPEGSKGAEREAIVAGGSWDLTGIVNTKSDWTGCVNYIKNHNYDNKGNLNVGMYFYTGGGHQVNFLYYKEVSGQQRIYAYDNNSPEKEIYFYMGSDNFIHMGPTDYIISLYGFDYEIDCLDLMDVKVYYPLANSYKPYRFIYANKNEITIENASYSILKCGPEAKDYVVYEIPMDIKEVKITPLVDGASFQYLDIDYNFGTVDEKTFGILTILSDSAIEGQTTSFEIKNAPSSPEEPDDPDVNGLEITIKNYMKSLSVDYKSKLTFNSDVKNVDGYKIVWTVNGSTKEGASYTIDQATEKEYRVSSSIMKDGKIVKTSAEEVIYVNTGFFTRIITFFRSLFGKLPVYIDNIKQ